MQKTIITLLALTLAFSIVISRNGKFKKEIPLRENDVFLINIIRQD